MFLIQQRNKDSIQPYRLTLAGGTSHKQVGHTGKINNKVFVVYFFTNGNW